MTQENRNDAAVSETVGFILMFSIVILSMSMIYILGYPILQDHIESSVFENAQQSFIVLQSDMKRVAFEQVPVKTMKMKLHSSTLSVDDRSSIVVNYNGTDVRYNTGNIEFIKNEDILTYENGGLWMKQHPSGSILVSKPPIYTGMINNDNMTTIGVISVHGRRSTSGNGIASINMEHNSSNLIKPSEKVDVTITIQSAYSKQWARYLDENGFNIISSNSSSVSAQRLQTWLIIGSHDIDVSIM
ncbi:DUF7289 family protein [Methanomethylovorans sp.]|jgi:hypothetical protein|uniref:DUF7289 family protein n=1 Tax=Methanomethylovorans sp. TaxID=2758717 RepID=UPI002B96BDE4|nr:hypothetical protein [Methanomethylovorans sp.]